MKEHEHTWGAPDGTGARACTYREGPNICPAKISAPEGKRRRATPSALVDEPDEIEEMTVAGASMVELLVVVIERASTDRIAAIASRSDYPSPEDANAAARELSLAITYLEEAVGRINKAGYRRKGLFGITDAERT